MVRPAAIDPPAIFPRLWEGFSGSLGFDVGTNCGQSLHIMSERFGTVVGFEPCAESHEVASRAYPRIEILHAAVSDHDGEVTLALIEGEQADTGQLVSPGTHGMEWDPGDWEDGRVTRVQVPCWTLDTLATTLGDPDFVKVDTEGHEARVLEGAPKLLAARRTSWLVEFHNPDLYAWCKGRLEAADCEVETVRHPSYPPHSQMWHQHGWIRAWPKTKA